MYKVRPQLIVSVCLTSTIGIALLKLYYPSQPYFDCGLILVILLTILLERYAYIYIFGCLALLVITGSLFLSSATIRQEGFMQQMFSSGISILAIWLAWHLKKLYRSIEEQRTQMNALFEYANEGIILTNNKGEILLINPQAQQLFEHNEEEVKGKQITMLIPEHHSGVRSEHVPHHHADPLNQETTQYLYAVKKSKERFPIEIHLSHFKLKKESFVLIFINDVFKSLEAETKLSVQKAQFDKINSDVRKMNVELENKVSERTMILREALSELERSQIELNNALNEEKELNEIKSRFVSMASHEFRTPLSTILSSASLLLKYPRAEENPQRERHIFRIKDSVKHMTDMLEDFLNLGKLEEGKVFREVVVFDVKEFLHDVIDELEASLKPGQHIVLNMQGEAAFATDKRLLTNVLINLLNNAVKFSHIDQSIDVRVDNTGNKLTLEIKDQGIGIPIEDMPHLFTTFYRGTNAINIHGTGLGLHIVKRYIDIMEGEINLTSQLNEGTIFVIGLPNLKEPK